MKRSDDEGTQRPMDLRPSNCRALALASEVIAAVRPEQLGLPTPCSAWTVGDLLRHMISQNKRFAAAARGEEADAACPLEGGELGDDPAATYRDSADLAFAAFLVEDIADRRMVLEELPGPLPALVAISFHFTDSLVHGWDVARSIGAPFQPPTELSGAALGIASRIPDEARGPGGGIRPGHRGLFQRQRLRSAAAPGRPRPALDYASHLR